MRAVLWCRGGDVKWAAGAAGAGPELLSLLSPPDLRQEGLWPVAARTAQNVPVCTVGKQEDARQ